MAGQVHHVAVNTANFEETVRFFEELFDMEVLKANGEAPNRKLWFRQGIQVNEAAEILPGGNRYDHIGIQVPNREEIVARALAMGCSPVAGKPYWFITGDDLMIELMA